MKKVIIIFLAFLNFAFTNAQPLQDCFTASKRLFLTCNNDTLLYKTDTNINEAFATKSKCFRIRDIIDSLNTKLFKIEIYLSDKHFKKIDDRKMVIFLTNLVMKNSFNYYLNIPKFKEEIYFINVSKKRKTKKVGCYMCKDSINTIDVLPNTWIETQRKKSSRKLKKIRI